MFKTMTNVLILAVMLVAFIGQAMAFNSAFSCESSDTSHAAFERNDQIHHNDLAVIDNGESVDCCGIECCNVNCNCSATTCSTIAYFSVDISSVKRIEMNDVFYTKHSHQPELMANLLFRPPIFTS